MLFSIQSHDIDLSVAITKGECLCHCQDGCPKMWVPDKEEQRYCWGCSKWFNTSCLTKIATTQASVAEKQIALKIHKNHTNIVIKVAFQPTVRGGAVHFVSGNGHIVHLARGLLNDMNPESNPMFVAHSLEAEGGSGFSKEDAWAEIMEEKIGLRKDSRGRADREQLIILDQQMFTCPTCENMVL